MSDTVPGMAEAINQRRKQLGLTPGQFATAAGLTRQGLGRVQKGVRAGYQDRTLLGVARALRWPADWYDRLLRGEDWAHFPTQVRAPGGATLLPGWPDHLAAELAEQGRWLTDVEKAALVDEARRIALPRRDERTLGQRADDESAGPVARRGRARPEAQKDAG